ncbi:Mechanosensitive ion channel protein 9 [Bienertia sinuspersici]
MMSSSTASYTIHIPNCNNKEMVDPIVSNFLKFVLSRVVSSLTIPVVLGCSLVAAIVALPFLVASFVVARLFQFVFGCGYVYDKATTLKIVIQIKLVIRTWIYIDSAYIMCVLVILYGVAQIPRLGLKDIMVIGFPIMHWIETYFILFGIGSLSYILSIICIRFVMFCIPLKYHTFKSGSHVVSDTVHEIIDSFILLLFAEHMIIIRFPFLKDYELLGFYPVHRLFHVIVLLLVFHDLIRLSMHILVWQLHKLVSYRGTNPNSFRYLITTHFWGRKSLVYWANGLKPSIMFTFTSIMLLVAWVFYFGHQPEKHKHETINTKKVLNFGKWSFFCLFIFSLLWLFKTCILLVLENRIVYSRFGLQISKGGKQLYFLGIIGRIKHDILKLQYDAKPSSSSSSSDSTQISSDGEKDHEGGCLHAIKHAFKLEKIKGEFRNHFTKRGASLLMLSIFPIFLIKEGERYQHPSDPVEMCGNSKQQSDCVKKLSIQKKLRVKEDLLTQQGDIGMLYELQRMVQHLLAAKSTLLNDKYTSDILQKLKECDGIKNGLIEKTFLMQCIIDYGEIELKKDGSKESKDKSNWDAFVAILHEYDQHVEDSTSKTISSEQLETWMEKARKNCVFLANTLSSAKELVESLDRIMSVLLIVVAFILWLLLTGLTTIQAIVVIGSPILAFNFMFGDTTKTFFQGIVFVYTVHPFDVGDLCIIDQNMLEVITIGVWKTTFSKVDTQDEVIYPNSDLVNKTIINHKTEFDWNDNVDIYVESKDNKTINRIKRKIKEELKNEEKYESTPGGIIEVMTTPENTIKIGVNFRYNVNRRKKNMSYVECLREKRQLRSEFVQEIVGVDDNKNDNEGSSTVQGPEILKSI